MRQQNFLDLARIDVGATRDDHVLRAVLEREKAVGVECAEIAGMQPAALERGGGRFRIAPIARHHHVAAAQDLAGLADRHRRVVGVGHHHLEARERPAG